MIVTLFSKPDCHLCEAVERVIERVRRDVPFDLVKRNIVDDPRDLETYGELIPVVVLDCREVARYRMTEAQLRAALQSKSSGV